MEPGQVRLAVDLGTSVAVAVVAWADGQSLLVRFDGQLALSGAVFVEPGGTLVTGVPAWQRAVSFPDRLVPAPLALREDQVAVEGDAVSAVELVAAVLRRAGEEAARAAGGPVADVRLVVPAGWGPRRRTWLRQAAHRARLGHPRLVEAPVAAADYLLATGVQVRVGAYVLVVDVGGGGEATVLRRGPAGFEVLATLHDLDAGGTRLDHILVGSLTVHDEALAGAARDGARWPVVASVRAAKEALSLLPAVTVAWPAPHPPMVINGQFVELAARPVVERVVQLATDTLAAAELTAEQLTGVYLIGGTASLPVVAEAVRERVGVPVTVVSEPGLAAVRGAAHATAAHMEAGGPVSVSGGVVLPPLRRAAAMAVPGVASLGLVAQFLLSASWENGSRIFRGPGFYVIANWGELALAALFAMLACVSAGTVLGSVLARTDPTGARAPVTSRVGTGVLAATALGAAIAGLYAVTGSLYFGLPIGPFLRWALVPLLPVAVLTAAIAVVVSRWRRTPVAGWHGFLNFPASSVVAAAAGMVLMQYSVSADRWPELVLFIDAAGRVGALLIGVAAALAVVRPLAFRLIVAAPLAVFCAAIFSWQATGVLAVVYVVAVVGWWAQRLWLLIRSPRSEPARA